MASDPNMLRKVQEQHWYRIAIGECPVCGREAGFRERVYGPPPEDRQQRYVYLSYMTTYCGCLDR